MFHAYPSDFNSVTTDGALYDHITHPIGERWFYIRASYDGSTSLDLPTRRMMITSSLPLLDRILSGEEEGPKIHQIQLVEDTELRSPFEACSTMALVTRITRLSPPGQSALSYLIETKSGLCVEGVMDGQWSSYPQTLLFDCYAAAFDLADPLPLSSRAPLEDKEASATSALRSKILIRLLDLCAADVERTERWWSKENTQLGGKAPQELDSYAEYQLLDDLLGRFEQERCHLT